MRLSIIKTYILILFLTIIGGLGFAQILKGNYYFNLSKRNCVRIIPEEGLRGIVRDINGNVLIGNYLSLNVSVIPQEITNKSLLFKKLAKLFKVSADSLESIYRKKFLSPFSPVVLIPDISKDTAIMVLERQSQLPGLFIQKIPKRVYPYKKATAHILGYTSEIDPLRFSRLKDYGFSFRDKIGYGGVEEYFDSYLRGEDGGRQVQIDCQGKQVKLLGIKNPTKGKDLDLTIDVRMQKIAHEVLANRCGSIVVMDPYDGKILALVSSPSFDPGIFVKSDRTEVVQALSDKRSPLLNRAISGQYPLGSVFKVVTAIAGLETGKISTNKRFLCNGSFKLGSVVFDCWSTHGSQDLREALVHSCNVYFYNMGKIIGIDILYKYAKLFALGEKTYVELPSESRGMVPSPEWKKKIMRIAWYVGDTINISIGQGQLTVTPIQAARLMCSFANGGYLIRPYLVNAIGGLDVSKKSFVPLGLNERNLSFIKQSLYDVVNLPDGTANYAKVEGLAIAGKTGTAQAQGGAHGWFAGFTPIDKPKIVFVVMLEHIGSSAYAAKVAQKMLEEFKKEQIL